MHPDFFSIGPLTVHAYGVFAAIGLVLASIYQTHHASKVGLTKDEALDLFFIVVISGFVGARLLYVIYEWKYFVKAPLEIFAIWNGGIIYYGGLIGGLIAFAVRVRMMKKSFLQMLDMWVPSVALSHIFGRIGCFFNGCCYGRETTCPLGVVFPFHEKPLHPTQLYEAVFCIFLFLFLNANYKKNHTQIGETSFFYFTLYPIGRFVIEMFRNDMGRTAGLTLAQWVSIAIFTGACLIAAKVKARTK